MASFSVPDWSGMPQTAVNLEILENGVIKGDLDLSDKATYSIGRNKEFCDHSVDEPLMSRKHAIIQHKNDGTLYIFDLGILY